MDALTVALAAGIGVIVVAIVGVIAVIARGDRRADDDIWSAAATPGDAPDGTAAPWATAAPRAARPLPASTAKVALEPATRAALTTWQDQEGELLDRWLQRHDDRLTTITGSSARAAAYQEVLKEMSAAEERLVHEAIERAPDDELRSHLAAMHAAAIDALIEATKGDMAASSARYAAYLRSRGLSEARMAALEP